MSQEQRKIQIIADGSQVNATLNQMAAAAKLLQNQLRKLPPESEEFAKKSEQFKNVRANMKSVKDEMYGTQNAMSGMITKLGPMAAAFGVAFGVKTVINFLKDSSNAAKNFESALSSLSSITGATGEDLQFYKEQAALIGSTTTLSASQAVDAFKLMGSARPELLKNKEALAEVTAQAVTLAEAAGIELTSATTALAGAMNQFQLPASDAARVINALAAGSKEGAASIPEISSALDKFGVAASSFNVSFEESVGLVETLAEFNVKGAESGTALRNVLSKMASAEALPKEALVQLEKFGVDLGVVSDKTLPMNERLAEFSKISGDATALTKVFGAENRIAGEIILKNVDKFEKYSAAVTGTNTAVEQARTNTDNLEGDIKAFGSALEAIQITLGGGINSIWRPFVQIGTQVLQFFLEVYKRADPIRSLFAAVSASVQLLWENIKNLVGQFINFNSEGDAADSTVKALTTAFEILLFPIKLIADVINGLLVGFAHLYNESERLRGTLSGFASAVIQVFNNLKEGAMQALGGVANLLIGIFTLDADKIKQGLKDTFEGGVKTTIFGFGKGVADEYSKGYEEGIDKRMEVAAVKELEAVKAATDEKSTEINEVVEAKQAEQVKILEEKSKEKQANEKKHQEQMKKLRDDFAKAELEQQKIVEDLRLQLIDDAIEQKMAKTELEFQREMAKLEEKKAAILANEAITEQERNALLDQYEAERAMREQIKAENLELIRQEERKISLETMLMELDEEEAMKQERLNQYFLNGMASEYNKQETMLHMQEEFMRRKLEILEEQGQGETLAAEKLRTNLIKIDQEMADERIKNEQRVTDAKRFLADVQYSVALEAVGLAVELMSEENKQRKGFVEAFKALQIGQILIDSSREVAAIWRNAQSNPLNALIPGFGTVLATAQTALAVVRTTRAVQRVRSTQYAQGGATGSGAPVDLSFDSTSGSWFYPGGKASSIGAFAKGGFVGQASVGLIGEKGPEYVSPNWMLQSPKYANLFGYLESERLKGRAYAEGGITASASNQPASFSAQQPANDQSMKMMAKFDELLMVMMEVRDNIEMWPQVLKVINDPRDIAEGFRVLNEIESDSRISR
jgi:TP901 family phage tail tape measure protein